MTDSVMAGLRAPVSHRTVERHAPDGHVQAAEWGVAVEAPVEIALNGMPWTVMLATPADLEDLAVGIALTERVLTRADAVQRLDISAFLTDVAVNLVAPASAIDAQAMRSRSLLSSSACGLCGLESLVQLHQRRAHQRGTLRHAVTDDAVRAAFAELPAHQPLNAATRSVHAAAWCQLDGTIALVREDVGRHNALDKLIGALARAGQLEDDGFVIMSSRCSYELVYKTVHANAQLLATLSAPTTMALEWADALGLPLACRGAGTEVVRFPQGVGAGHAG